MARGGNPWFEEHPGRRGVAAFALGAVVALAVVPALGAESESVHSFDVVLAPVALDGTFPLTVDLGDDGPLAGTLRVDTDVRGRLTGTLDLAGRELLVAGSASHGKGGSRVAFTARQGKDRISFAGVVEGSTLVGEAKGHGAVAPGKHPCTVDLAGAAPLVATLEFRVAESAKGRLSGPARVVGCGDAVKLRLSGRRTKKGVAFVLAGGRSFSFSASGDGDASGFVVDWKARGFGGTSRGEAAVADPLDPPVVPAYAAVFHELETGDPIAPIVPTAGAAPRGAFTVAPPLPAGLRIDAGTGTISGTTSEFRDTADYVVTAANFAGSGTFTLRIRTRSPRAKSFEVETRPLDDDDLRHFLLRTRFAATPAAIGELRASGVGPAVDAMLVLPRDTAAEALAAPELVNTTDPPGLEGKFPSSTQLGRWWSSLLMNNAEDPFQERLAFFWHDHFAASSDVLDGGETHFMVGYVNLFRHRGTGNLRDLLVALARDPCMLKYLDGYRNTAARPNENFAREFWELFTLGVDNGYTQADIVEGARAFTGYKRVTDASTGLVSMVFDPKLHDATAKTVLGRTIPGQGATDDYEAMVDVTLAERPVAEFVTRKLFEHFGHENPAPELVSAMAANLRENGWELAPFLRRLFTSEAFFAPKSRRSLVKNPVDFTVGFVHATGLKVQVSTLGNHLRTLGQFPTEPPTVNGWPLGRLWLSSQNMADRVNAVYSCVEDTTRQRTAGIEVAAILPPVAERTPAAVLDSLAALLRVDLAPEERQVAIDYLNTVRNSNGTVTPSPFDGSNQSHLDERVRGLLWILAQHPTHQVR